MTSGKQKRRIIDVRRLARLTHSFFKRAVHDSASASPSQPPDPAVRVNKDVLAPYNSYGEPDFVTRGYYVDQTFECACCGEQETWRATQQKWWYEVAKGFVYATAKYCVGCRRKRREGRWRREDEEAEAKRQRKTS